MNLLVMVMWDDGIVPPWLYLNGYSKNLPLWVAILPAEVASSLAEAKD